MASERSHTRASKHSLLPRVGYDEAINVLNLEAPRALADMLWRRSEWDESLRRQIVVKVLEASLGTTTGGQEVNLFLSQLAELCQFEAEWRDCENGWAEFLEAVCSAVEKIHWRVPFSAADRRIEAIIHAAEESSHQIDECYLCDNEIERLSKILDEQLDKSQGLQGSFESTAF